MANTTTVLETKTISFLEVNITIGICIYITSCYVHLFFRCCKIVPPLSKFSVYNDVFILNDMIVRSTVVSFLVYFVSKLSLESRLTAIWLHCTMLLILLGSLITEVITITMQLISISMHLKLGNWKWSERNLEALILLASIFVAIKRMIFWVTIKSMPKKFEIFDWVCFLDSYFIFYLFSQLFLYLSSQIERLLGRPKLTPSARRAHQQSGILVTIKLAVLTGLVYRMCRGTIGMEDLTSSYIAIDIFLIPFSIRYVEICEWIFLKGYEEELMIGEDVIGDEVPYLKIQ